MQVWPTQICPSGQGGAQTDGSEDSESVSAAAATRVAATLAASAGASITNPHGRPRIP
jgi:hypothetical protein